MSTRKRDTTEVCDRCHDELPAPYFNRHDNGQVLCHTCGQRKQDNDPRNAR